MSDFCAPRSVPALGRERIWPGRPETGPGGVAMRPAVSSPGQTRRCRRSRLRAAAVTSPRKIRLPRPGQVNGQENSVSEHVPPSLYPASSIVIPPPAAADLANRQGPCLRNSSGAQPGPDLGTRCAAIMTRDAKPAPTHIPDASCGPRTRLPAGRAQRPGRPSGRALGVLGSDQLCDLRGIEGRALAEVVTAHEEVDGPGIVE